MEKFHRHWNHRLGLETLKMKHARAFGSTPNEKQREIMRDEIINYIESCYHHEELTKLDDVFITDHQIVPKKYVTTSDEEDQDFYEYQQAIEAYNDDGIESNKIFGSEKSDYSRGSILQRALDPFFGSGKDEFGTIVINIEDRDLAHFRLNDVEKVKAEIAALRSKNDTWELEEDKEVARIQLLKEIEQGN